MTKEEMLTEISENHDRTKADALRRAGLAWDYLEDHFYTTVQDTHDVYKISGHEAICTQKGVVLGVLGFMPRESRSDIGAGAGMIFFPNFDEKVK